MREISEVRIDKYLWAVRLYKTRSLATEACKKGKVSVDNQAVKPSRQIKQGTQIHIRKDNIYFRYKALKLLEKRVGAKLVDNYLENITPKEELDKLELDLLAKNLYRQRGAGRPTKKERRDIDRFWESD